MTTLPHNLRKAALLIRSLDAQTAAQLLAQLSPTDAAAVRAAIEQLGQVDSEEQADLAAELRRAVPVVSAGAAGGVELTLSATREDSTATGGDAGTPTAGFPAHFATNERPSKIARFEFLEQAPIANLVHYLAREHAQTIAVVLSYLSPARAAAVLAALSPAQQADALERLSLLGETDAESVNVVEQELAAWVAAQSIRRHGHRAGDAVNAILSAADATTRDAILANLNTRKHRFAATLPKPADSKSLSQNRRGLSQFFRVREEKWDCPLLRDGSGMGSKPAVPSPAPSTARRTAPPQPHLGTQLDALRNQTANFANGASVADHRSPRALPGAKLSPDFRFEDLPQLPPATLAAVLNDVGPDVLVLALAASSDELVQCVAGQLPKKIAKQIRRRLAKLGPTRLSDMETAQQAIARCASRHRHSPTTAAAR